MSFSEASTSVNTPDSTEGVYGEGDSLRQADQALTLACAPGDSITLSQGLWAAQCLPSKHTRVWRGGQYLCQVLGEVHSPSRANGTGKATGDDIPTLTCLPPPTLHGLDEVPDSVGPDAESCTLLHELGRDVVVRVQIVHCLGIQLH